MLKETWRRENDFAIHCDINIWWKKAQPEGNYFTPGWWDAQSSSNAAYCHMRDCYTYTLYIPMSLIICNMFCLALLSNNVQIKLLAKGGERRNKRGVEGWGYIIHVKTLYHRNDLIYLSFSPKVWIMKAFTGAPYIAVFILNLWLTEARAGKPLWNP